MQDGLRTYLVYFKIQIFKQNIRLGLLFFGLASGSLAANLLFFSRVSLFLGIVKKLSSDMSIVSVGLANFSKLRNIVLIKSSEETDSGASLFVTQKFLGRDFDPSLVTKTLCLHATLLGFGCHHPPPSTGHCHCPSQSLLLLVDHNKLLLFNHSVFLLVVIHDKIDSNPDLISDLESL